MEIVESMEIGESDASWGAIERAALNDVVIYRMVSLIRAGMDRETALIGTLLYLAAERRAQVRREVERLMREPAAPIIVGGEM
jgi:hypothetical protein